MRFGNSGLKEIYRCSLSLLTDLYELTMANGYFKRGMGEREAVFCLFFRENPFHGGYTIACGLEAVIDFVEAFGFDDSDCGFLSTLTGNDGKPVFDPSFIEALAKMRPEFDLDAAPEGTVVFPHEPIVRLKGPLLQCQLVETPLLTLIGFPSLVATKAARIVREAGGDPVLEFGLRRAQGIDGGLTASRAAYIGGCAKTSNVLAAKQYDIPLSGTQAHSWIMSFDDELEAFTAYAKAMPNNCTFLVDTYDTLAGVRNAIAVGKILRERGHRMAGVRLDSGDLASLSVKARQLLDQEGFEQSVIIGSNDLDEYLIRDLRRQGAKIGAWGVGTKLSTAFDQPALGCVYKLTAIRTPPADWQYRLKLSEQPDKMSIPGMLQVRRYRRDGEFIGDLIFDLERPPAGRARMVNPLRPTRTRAFDPEAPFECLLQPVLRGGKPVAKRSSLEQARNRARLQLDGFHDGIKRLDNPDQYPVGLEAGLHAHRNRLIKKFQKTRGSL